MLINCAKALIFICGMCCGWMGPLLGDFCAIQHVTMGDVGAMVAASSSGNMLTNLLGKKFIDFLGSKWTLFCSALCLVSGSLVISMGNGPPILWFGSLLFGMGGGLNSIASTVAILETEKKNPHAALNGLHLFFGLGALLGPSVAGFAHSTPWSYRLVYAFAGAYALVVGLIISTAKKPQALESVGTPPPSSKILFSIEIWIYALVIMFYVGIENSTWTYLNVYLEKGLHLSYSDALKSVTFMWIGMCAGRILCQRLNLTFPPLQITLVSMVLVLVSFLALIYAPNLSLAAMGLCCLLGLAFGPIFPNSLATATSRFAASSALVSSVVISAGAVGGTVFPYATGAFIDRFGLYQGISFIMGASVLMLASFLFSRKLSAKAETQTDASPSSEQTQILDRSI